MDPNNLLTQAALGRITAAATLVANLREQDTAAIDAIYAEALAS